jgi:DNA-binding XRE family transcriptional regulator
MQAVTKFSFLSDHKLRVSFADGTSGVADLSPRLVRVLEPLRDPKVFRTARLEDGTIVWRVGSRDIPIAPESLYALAHRLEHPKTHADARRNETVVSLREIRAMSDMTQVDLAEALEVTQPTLSALENTEGSAKIETVRRYLRELGWRLELVAVKGDRRVVIRGM